MEPMLNMFGVGNGDMRLVQKRSIRNQFYSDLVTLLEDKISVPGTTVHIFYALKMGEKYGARYHRHFKDPDIRRHDMQHEELLVRGPEEWARRCAAAAEWRNENESIGLWRGGHRLLSDSCTM